MERAGNTFGMAAYLHFTIAILVYAYFSSWAGDNNLHTGVFKAINMQVAVVGRYHLEPAVVSYPAQVYVILGAGK